MTKRVLIELIQNRLAGGDAPSDVQGKYPKQVIERLIALVYADIATQSKKKVRNMALSYSATVVSSNSTYYVVLPVKPLNLLNGIVWITGLNGEFIPTSNGLEQTNIMAKIMPFVTCTASNIVENKMYFSSDPNTTSVTLDILPDFANLGEDSNVCVEGVESEIFSMVMAKMRENVSQLEEIYNNKVADTDKPTNPAK